MGEKASDAAIREVYEESGLKVEIDRLLFVHENFFEMEDGLHHEVVFYYLMKDIGEQKIVCDRVLDNMDAGLVWLSIYSLNKSTVYPKIYNTILTNMPNEVTYFITDERTQ